MKRFNNYILSTLTVFVIAASIFAFTNTNNTSHQTFDTCQHCDWNEILKFEISNYSPRNIEVNKQFEYYILNVTYKNIIDIQSDEKLQYDEYLFLNLEKDLRIIQNGFELAPVNYHYEGGRSILGYDRILLAFDMNFVNEDLPFDLIVNEGPYGGFRIQMQDLKSPPLTIQTR